MLDTPLLHPLFAASQELDLPIWIHGGAYRPPLTPWVDATNGVYHGIGGLYALHGLIGGGVFDLFPKLRVGLFESGCGWLPWAMEKLDALGPDNPMTPNLKRTPSEILEGGQIFCSVEPDETFVEHAVEVLGEDIWLFSTDYPHSGTPWPDGVSMIAERALPESAKIKLLGENARRLLPRLGSTVGK
jgi:predicted TIM-barrel fold metal-dependent hydrolase